jgi:hypothetical protein
MRIIFVILATLLAPIYILAQEGKELPIDVKLKKNNIVFTIPPPYNEPQYKPVAIPNFVIIHESQEIHEYRPAKNELLAQLEEELARVPLNEDRESEIEYLENIALYLYIADNNVKRLPNQARILTSEWCQKETLQSEAGLIKRYIEAADSLTNK